MGNLQRNQIVFDLETQHSFDEVGGRGNLRLLKISVLGAYDYRTGELRCYEEHELPAFEARLRERPLLIGFNIRQFDLPVLAPYLKTVDPLALPVLDIMEEVTRAVGHRVSLNRLASATLGQQKISHGLEAIKFWHEGRIDELKAYCLDDVRLTRELYEIGKAQGELLVETNFGMDTVAVPVRWDVESQSDSTDASMARLRSSHS
ncbi:ribonuclease H-like domain-containing protein [Candidatus Parcubacteria bacterium]|nr:ribonuclease H-like domain-containing protein [Candidatus Parcubacteria bacterium]